MPRPLDPKDAIFYGSFVQAAYKMFFASDTNLRPDPVGVPDGWDVVAWITMKDFFLGRQFEKFYGILAQKSDDSNSYVLAIRGTEEAIEWYNNAFAFLIPFDHVPGSGYVHKGFMRIYDTIKVTPRAPSPARELLAKNAAAEPPAAAPLSGSFADQIAQVVQERSASKRTSALAQDVPATADVVVVAHSLGAALATLYVVDNVKHHGINHSLVCTFASPRVGDQTFVNTFNGFSLTSWRIVNAADLVPNVPPDVWAYRHIDTLALVDSTGEVQPTLACAHAMTTYDHMLDTTRPVDTDCAVTAEEAQLLREQLPDPATADQIRSVIEGARAGDA